MKLRVREAEHKKFPNGPQTDDIRRKDKHYPAYYRGHKALSVHCISTSKNHNDCHIQWCECECHVVEDYLDCMIM